MPRKSQARARAPQIAVASPTVQANPAFPRIFSALDEALIALGDAKAIGYLLTHSETAPTEVRGLAGAIMLGRIATAVASVNAGIEEAR